MDSREKTVLVTVRENRRIVSFSSEPGSTDAEVLSKTVVEAFGDVLKSNEDFFIQVKNEQWGGMFIDVLDKEIADKAIINVILKATEQDKVVTRPPQSTQYVQETSPSSPSVLTEQPPVRLGVTEGSRQMRLQVSSGSLELAASPSQETSESCSVNDEYIKEQSKIFGKSTTRSLSKYEQRMNDASARLCLHDPSLLSDRTLLLKECRRVVNDEGYDYKKGKSRSRFLNPELATERPKRKKINEEYRVSRIAELQERIKDITDQLGYKEKRRENASLSHNYKECDQITEQMSELKCERRKLDIELSGILQKQKKSKWYFAKKAGRSKSLPGSSSDSAQRKLAFSHRSSSCSSSHSVSPSPLSHTSSGNSSPHGPLSPASETESVADMVILSPEDEGQTSSHTVIELEENPHVLIDATSPTANDGESPQSF